MKIDNSIIEYLRRYFVNRTGDSTVGGNIVPDTTDAYNLGAPSRRYSTVYARSLVADNLTYGMATVDKVDGFDASATPIPNTLLALDGSAIFPTSVYPSAVLIDGTRVMTGALQISPPTTTSPIVLGANAQGQTVIGLKADQLNKSITAGDGLTGGGALTSSVSLAINWGSTPSTIQPDDVAAGGSAVTAARSDHKHAIVADAPTVNASVISTNNEGSSTSFSRSDHSHAVTYSSNPGSAASLLATDSNGYLGVQRIGIGMTGAPTASIDLESTTTPQAKIRYNATKGLFVSAYSDGNVGFDFESIDDWLIVSGKIGINAVSTDTNFYISKSSNGISGNSYAVKVYNYLNGTATAGVKSELIQTYFQGTADHMYLAVGTESSLFHASTYDWYGGYGFYSRAYLYDSGGMDIHSGYSTTLPFTYGAGSHVGTFTGYEVQGDASSSVDNAYGLFVGDLAGSGRTVWALYSNDSGISLGANTSVQFRGLGTIDTDGDLVLDIGGKDAYPSLNYDLNLGMLSKKFLTLHAAELWVETLVAQETIATIGGRVLVGPTNILTSDLTTGATTIYVKYNNFSNNDIVYMESSGKVEFMKITSSYSGTGPYSYSVTRDLDGSGANEWFGGDACFNTGQAGNGWIDLYSISSMKPTPGGSVTTDGYLPSGWVEYLPSSYFGSQTSSETTYNQIGPTIVGNVRNSLTYNDWSEYWAIGNLNGLYGISTDTYGAAFGKPGAYTNYMVIDTNSIRMYYNSVITGLWDNSGNIRVGDSSSQHLYYSSFSGLQINNGAYTRFTVDDSGNLKIKNNLGADVIVLDNTGSSYFAGVMTIGTSGEIRQGTGTIGTDFNGLRIWRDSNVGRIAGYNSSSTNPQWYGSTDGKFYAGTGNVVLDIDGLSLNYTSTTSTRVKWYSGTTLKAYVGPLYNPVYEDTFFAIVGDDIAGFEISIDNSTSGLSAGVRIDVTGDETYSLYLSGSDGVRVETSLYPDNVYASPTSLIGVFTAGLGALDVWLGRDTDGGYIELASPLGYTAKIRYGDDYYIKTSKFKTQYVNAVNSLTDTPDSGASAGDISYYHNLRPYRDGAYLNAYAFVPLQTALTNTSWDGDDTKTTGTYSIDTSTWGAPAGVKAVLVQVSATWSSAGSGNTLALRPKSGTVNVAKLTAHTTNPQDMTVWCPCDNAGDIDVVISGAGISNAVLRIWGYAL